MTGIATYSTLRDLPKPALAKNGIDDVWFVTMMARDKYSNSISYTTVVLQYFILLFWQAVLQACARWSFEAQLVIIYAPCLKWKVLNLISPRPWHEARKFPIVTRLSRLMEWYTIYQKVSTKQTLPCAKNRLGDVAYYWKPRPIKTLKIHQSGLPLSSWAYNLIYNRIHPCSSDRLEDITTINFGTEARQALIHSNTHKKFPHSKSDHGEPHAAIGPKKRQIRV